MKIALVTNCIYKTIPEYVKLSDRSKRWYCDLHGFDYIRKSDNPHPDIHPVWSKPSVLLSQIYKYEWLVWIDADAMITNDHFDLGSYLSTVGEKVVMIKDINGWNNGVFAVPCTSVGRDWLDEIESRCHEPKYQRGFREQQAMADSFEREWSDFVTQPPAWIGWNDYMPAIYNRSTDANVWREGESWILHLPGVRDDKLRADIFRRLSR